jgi:hypothetical protein
LIGKRSLSTATIATMGALLSLSLLMVGCGSGSGSNSSSGGGSTGVSHTIELAWTGDASAVGYIVYRRSASSITSFALNGVPITTAAFSDTARSGDKLFYRVTAVDANGFESEPSDEVSVVVP